MLENQAFAPAKELENASPAALAEAIIALLLEKKGKNLTAYFVGEENAITDYYINITATSTTSSAIARTAVDDVAVMLI